MSGPLLDHLHGGVQPVHLGHRHVHDDHVRVGLLDQRHRVQAVAGLAGDLQVGVVLEDAAEPLADQRVVVDQDDADGHGQSYIATIADCTIAD